MFGAIGLLAISLTLVLLGNLSRRMGIMTRARPYYILLYVASLLMALGAFFRLFFLTGNLAQFAEIVQNTVYTLLADGLPAMGITLALFVAWYYWSWLLAERD
jgi:hypothetical protein